MWTISEVKNLKGVEDQLTQKVDALLDKITTNISTVKVFRCQECNDIGWIVDQGANSARPCKCSYKAYFEKLMGCSGISSTAKAKTFDAFKTNGTGILFKAKTLAIAYVREFEQIRKQESNSIAFCGQVGSGKTHLALAICYELLTRNIKVVYMDYRDALTRLKQNLMEAESYQLEIQKYKTAELLFIDDLFKGKGKDENIVYEIINFRYFSGLPVVITSEHLCNSWLEFDEGTGSRLIEQCSGRIVVFQGHELNHRLNR